MWFDACAVCWKCFFFILLRIEMGQRNKNSWFYFVVIHSTFGITRAKVLVFILAYVCSNAHSVHAKRVCSCFSWTFYRIYFPVIHLRYERTSPRQSTIINLTRLALSASHWCCREVWKVFNNHVLYILQCSQARTERPPAVMGNKKNFGFECCMLRRGMILWM